MSVGLELAVSGVGADHVAMLVLVQVCPGIPGSGVGIPSCKHLKHLLPQYNTQQIYINSYTKIRKKPNHDTFLRIVGPKNKPLKSF